MDKQNQHFVPQGLLRQFTIPGERSLIWEISKSHGQYRRSPVSVKKICSRKFYYYQRNENDGIDHRTLEDKFSEIESIGSVILNSIIKQKDQDFVNLGQEERGKFSFYLALLLTRGPVFREAINDMHGALVQQLTMELQASNSLPEMPTALKEYIDAKGGIEKALKIQIFPQVSLGPMIEMARQIGISMIEKSWVIYRCKSTIPITDCPFVFFADNGINVGPANPNAQVIISLNRNIFLRVNPGANDGDTVRVEDADDEQLNTIRELLVRAANEYVYSSDKSDVLAQLVIKYRNQRQKVLLDLPANQMWNVLNEPPEGSIYKGET